MIILKKKLSKDHKKKIGLANTGNNNGQWKGNKVKYSSLHTWLRSHHKKSGVCHFCGRTDAKVYDWANVTGIYDRNIENYRETCRGCHIKLDRWNSLLFNGGEQ